MEPGMSLVWMNQKLLSARTCYSLSQKSMSSKKGKWQALKTMSPERLQQLRKVSTIKSEGPSIDYPDAQNAAIALQYDLQLFTRNVRDFEKIESLRLVNPWE